MTDGRTSLHVVVLKPGTDEILWEESWGDDKSTWTRPYDEIAMAKAKLAQRTGMTIRTLRQDAPWLYEQGDIRFVGGVIENGLVVAASGLPDHWDEAISRMVLSALQGACRHSVSKIDQNSPPFFQ
jgi:hypothetical protein